jgi:hypothetical protein
MSESEAGRHQVKNIRIHMEGECDVVGCVFKGRPFLYIGTRPHMQSQPEGPCSGEIGF